MMGKKLIDSSSGAPGKHPQPTRTRHFFRLWWYWLVGAILLAVAFIAAFCLSDGINALQAASTLGFLVVTGLYAVETRRMADAMQQGTRDERTRRTRTALQALLPKLLEVQSRFVDLHRTFAVLIPDVNVRKSALGTDTRARDIADKAVLTMKSELNIELQAVPVEMLSRTQDLIASINGAIAAYETLRSTVRWYQSRDISKPSAEQIRQLWEEQRLDSELMPTWDKLIRGAIPTGVGRAAEALRGDIERWLSETAELGR